MFSDLMGERHPITFNLSSPLQFADSKTTHGIQIADAIAAAAVYVFSGAQDEHSNRWREIIPTIGHYGSIIPDRDDIDLKDRRVQRNAIILMELHSRAKESRSLIHGMSEYLQVVSRRLSTHPIME